MTKKQVQRILEILKAAYPAYPAYYDEHNADSISIAVDTWYDALKNEPVCEVAMAVKSIIATEKSAPSLAEILDKINYTRQKFFHEASEFMAIMGI